MLRQIYQSLYFFPILFLFSCSPSLEDLSWLEGNWQRQYNDVTQVEVWKRQSDTLLGLSYFIKNGDSTLQETMTIYRGESKLEFNARIPEQGIDTRFKQLDDSENRISFENPENDFPQTIVYERKGDSLYAAIIGKSQGFDKSVVFGFSRLP